MASVRRNEPTDFEKFDRTMRDLLKVPHTEIKAKLDAEKKAKKRKKAKKEKNHDAE
jgi:hypothetical protein